MLSKKMLRTSSEKLGETDDIKTAIEELEKDFEILKIVWPDDDTEGDDEENDDDEDGSDALDPNVDYDDDEDEEGVNAPDRFQKEETPTLTYGQSFTKRLLELKWSDEDSKEFSNASSKDDEEGDDDQDPDAKIEPADPTENGPKAIEQGWDVEKDEEGNMTISNKRFKVELDPDETMELLNKIVDKQVARFKNEQGKIVYVFSPRGSEYVLKTPEFQGGFRIPKDIIKKMLD
jgi:hypothetical protein